ncbi:MauE/DoxX family redox-associated membrane protein [Pedobacter gandavensis]|uniref:MauE/DoxX family redox-associated membrane protein n=1 Tax=Pedobacter gandavensis TaxID=2679963 RepID=UPI00292EE2D9|nr:MauE/DoxX family redox-associated membrane protein [Pedobacter gandavensis]
MDTSIKGQSRFQISDKARELSIEIICYLFIALFIYTATDKIFDFKSFHRFLGRLDFLHTIGPILAYLIPVAEIAVSILLLIPKTKRLGLYLSLAIMILFTSYLVFMKLTLDAEHLPCHCGGAITRLSWTQHIWFNLGFILLAGIGIKLINSKKSS